MSLLVALLRDGDFASAEKLITTDPSSVWTKVDNAGDSDAAEMEEPSIFYSFKSVDIVEQILLARPEYAWVCNTRGDRPLHCACQIPDIDNDVIRILLFAFPEGASTRNKDGKLPIHYAAANIQNVAILKEIVDAFPQGLNMAEHKNDSKPLHYACAFKRTLAVVEFLCDATEKSMSVTRDKDRQGNLPLHLALMYETEISVSSYLLKMYPEAAEITDAKGRSSLQLAVQCPTMTEAFTNDLISIYPDAVNIPYKSIAAEGGDGPRNSTSWFIGKKPIHVAIKSGTKASIVRSLIRNTLSSAYIERNMNKAQDGMNMLERKKLKAVKSKTVVDSSIYVEEKISSDTDEEKAVENKPRGDLKSAMQEKIEAEVDIDALEREEKEEKVEEKGVLFGDTILHTALEFNATEEIVETILKELPQIVKEPNDDGKLPIHYAAWRQCSLTVLKLLIKYFPEGLTLPDQKNDNLALHYGIQYSPRGENADVSVALLLLSHSPAAVFNPNRGGYFPIHLAARAASSPELIEALLRVCPYSYAFATKNYLKLLPIDFALFFGAPTPVISMLLGVPKRMTTSPDPNNALKTSSSPPLVWRDVDGVGEGPAQLDANAGMEHPPPEEVPIEEEHPLRTLGCLKSALLNLQEKYMQQGEEMRKMRVRMHNQAKLINERSTEVDGLKRDIGWRNDRIKILEREVKALKFELESLK